jgi:hypothetical protein
LPPAGLVAPYLLRPNHAFQNWNGHGATSADIQTLFDRLAGFNVHDKSDKTPIELRIARAYIRLLCAPANNPVARTVSIARIGDHEIILFEDWQAEGTDKPLFWIELFDHGVPVSIDSGACHKIEEAAAVFEQFLVEAERLEGPRRQANMKPQG